MTSGTTDLVMPKLGLTMTEGLLVEWQVGDGDEVRAGDVLFVVETDKVSTEIEAPGDGVIEAILVNEGETVATGTPLARWSGPGLPDMVAEETAAETTTQAQRTELGVQSPQRPPTDTSSSTRIVATPHARRLALESGIDLSQLAGSGPGGRIKAEDVVHAGASRSAPIAAERIAPAQERLLDPGSIRSTMAERMAQATREVPHFYLTANVVADPLLELRQTLNAKHPQLRFTVGHFVVAAVARALAARPDDNRVWADGRYRVLGCVDVGVAVAVDSGLLAPLLRDAGTMTLSALAFAHEQLVSRARSGELAVDDMSGGAVTVSNLGAHGVDQVFPIINPPQSLIFGIGAARAALTRSESGEIVSETLLPIVLGADHRVFDGANAARILARVSEALQQPNSLLES